MINVLWNIVACLGVTVLALAALGTCILLVTGIICIIKQDKEEIHK